MKKYLLIGIGTLIFIYFISQFTFREVLNSLSSIGLIYAIAIILLNLPVLLLKTWRWKLLLSKYEISVNFSVLFSTVSAGFFLGLVTPGTAGELSRTLTLNIKKSVGVGTVIYEKFFDLITLIVFSIGALIFYFFKPLESIVVFIAICFGTYGILRIVYRKRSLLEIIRSFLSKILSKLKIKDKVDIVYRIFGELLSDSKIVFISIAISMLLWILSGIQFYLILQAINVKPVLVMAAICYFLPYLTGLLSFIPLGMGVLDFSMVGLMTGLYHFSSALSYTAALSFRLFATVPLVIWGYVCYLKNFIINKANIT